MWVTAQCRMANHEASHFDWAPGVGAALPMGNYGEKQIWSGADNDVPVGLDPATPYLVFSLTHFQFKLASPIVLPEVYGVPCSMVCKVWSTS